MTELLRAIGNRVVSGLEGEIGIELVAWPGDVKPYWVANLGSLIVVCSSKLADPMRDGMKSFVLASSDAEIRQQGAQYWAR
ncbi:hypothetical protein NLM27_25255 [Bradyrhizobium sp. CCGB12]|uniref:hypothetical protein n=1 Tax=Bradyrhizobium sp. CCGB12 TaxID=2949632 RepID=UPI0020B37835|nr:hypothetical protein [Bradyrhizobium sp. CCGB12]MCP3392100.1 hypothetical protein [Bradyrhizobium sp. CCGB12]